MLEPTAGERAWYAVGTGALAMGGLLAAARLTGAARALAVAAITAGVVALAFLAAGIGDELLRPDRWGELAGGITRGIDALPGARVPYRGIDEWTRIVIPLGGTVLTAVAALAAFWPRRSRVGFPLVALILLVTLYAVPAVALDFKGEFLRGALLALLVLAFLRLERLRLTEARGAAVLAGGTAVAALIVAPALDRDTPWWDYETWALSTAASHSTSFSWDHTYGPLDWPRDGREMLRVKARQPAYWKAENLDIFDGERWRQSHTGTSEATIEELPSNPAALDRWSQNIKVSVRNLRTRTFVAAGIVLGAPDMPHRAAIPAGPPGIWSASRTLRRGDTYTARVYTPRPTERELAAAGIGYDRDFSAFRGIELLDGKLPASAGPAAVQVSFPEWNDRPTSIRAIRLAGPAGRLRFVDGDQALKRSDLRRTWALSQRLKRGATNPFEYVKAVEDYLSTGFNYSESPPAAARTLEGFLFDAKSGYCQQYSGAMALLLRMAGIPARVATGFTAGSLDRRAERVRRARPRRALLGRGLVPRTSAGSRSTRRRPRRRRAPRATSAARRRSATRRRPRRRAAARATRAPPRARRTGPAGSSAPAAAWPRWPCWRSPGSPSAAAGALARRCRSSSARCAARAGPGPGRDAAGARGLLRPLARRGGLRARPARAALRRPRRRADARPAPRAALRTGPRRRPPRAPAGMVGAASEALLPSARRRTIDGHG